MTNNRKALEHVMSNVRLRREVYKMRKRNLSYGSVALAFSGSIALTGCHMTIGTPSAITAYHEGINGAIVEAKTSPDKESAYWQTRKIEHREKTLRETAPSFLSNLFNGGSK